MPAPVLKLPSKRQPVVVALLVVVAIATVAALMIAIARQDAEPQRSAIKDFRPVTPEVPPAPKASKAKDKAPGPPMAISPAR
jgi:hypothetical protein